MMGGDLRGLHACWQAQDLRAGRRRDGWVCGGGEIKGLLVVCLSARMDVSRSA